MFLKPAKWKKPLRIVLLLCLVLFLGAGMGFLINHVWSENGRFEAFTEEIFQREVTGSTLTLHYALAEPEKHGIKRPAPGLGTMNTDWEKRYQSCLNDENRLKEFSYQKLSKENRLVFDLLLLYFHTQRSLGRNGILEEPLGPSLGIQAQLPILLAEYAFYEKQDIVDYLKLLSSIRPYFQSILEFEEEKVKEGCFMSDTTLDRILDQCSAFVKNPEDNYMQEIFEKKIADYGRFSKKEQEKLKDCHRKILTEQVLPAYEDLIQGLKKLRGLGKTSRGLAYFKGGRQYYLYLLQSQVGTYVPVEKMEQRLTSQLLSDSRMINLMLREQPSLLDQVTRGVELTKTRPEEILEFLSEQIQKDFPPLKKVDYEVRYVHSSMEEFLSPAFYLTPPLDKGSPNVIYLNRSGAPSSLELFTTLAHEGFPGHLYQTMFFGQMRPADIRYLLSCTGYVEGWATYIEAYGYMYAAACMEEEAAADIARIAWLNRSVNLCLYSLMDIGIHYRGWDAARTAAFLKGFGIKDAKVVQEIFQYIVETPANYLKYYWGYLSLLDLKSEYEKKLGEEFDIRKFHQKLLEAGPVAFPVLEKYMRQEFAGENGEEKDKRKTAGTSVMTGSEFIPVPASCA